MTAHPDLSALHAYFSGLQGRLVAQLEALDGTPFRRDAWDRPEGGGGVSALIEGGKVFERGGVNFSHVAGAALPPSATAARPQLAGRRWTQEGEIVIFAGRFRSQERNRQDARERLIDLITQAMQAPRPRAATKPSAASRRRRLEGKRKRAQTKELRQRPDRAI